MTLSLLEILQELKKSFRTVKATPKLETLFSTIEQEPIDPVRQRALRKVLLGVGLKTSPTEFITAEPHTEDAAQFTEHYNHALYQKILPFCQLAYCEEQNGVAENHACKLATIFKDEYAVFNYLSHFAQENRCKDLVHDACLFVLPSPDACNFYRWKHFANSNSQVTKQNNMLNRVFRDLLPHAHILETIEKEGIEQLRANGGQLNIKAIVNKEQEVREAISICKKEEKKQIPLNATQAEKETRTRNLKILTDRKRELYLELAQLSMGLSINDASITVLHALYEHYKQNFSDEHKILINYGITEKDIALFHSLPRNNDDTVIPTILIDGADIGYPGFYIKKLDTQSDKGAALAACLGKITNCCQYLGGAGSTCAQHGISSANGGFYVLCRGDSNNPTFEDPILAQSWAWRSTNNALCLDSLEKASNTRESMIIDMYYYFAMELCARNPRIAQVNIGLRGGTTHPLPKSESSLSPIDYTGYRDSHLQAVLATPTMPYILYNEVTAPLMQEHLKRKIHDFFSNAFNGPGDLKNNEAIKRLISFLLKDGESLKKNTLLNYLRTIAGEHLEAFNTLFTLGIDYRNELINEKIDFAALQEGASIYITNDQLRNALHCAVILGDIELVKQVIAEGIDLNLQDYQGETALFTAMNIMYEKPQDRAKYLAIIELLLTHHADTNSANCTGMTSLIRATYANDLTMVHCLVANGAHPNVADNRNESPLFHAAEDGQWDIFIYLIEEKKALYNTCNRLGFSPLMMALKKGHFAIAAQLLTRKDIDFKHKNAAKQNALLWAASNPEMLNTVLQLYPENQRLAAIKTMYTNGDTVLHFAARNAESLKIVLGYYPAEQRLAAVQTTYKSTNTTFYYSGCGSTTERNTVLHEAANNPESLKILLALYPEDQKSTAIELKRENGWTVFHHAATNPESLKILLEFYPENQRFAVLEKISNENKGKPLLHTATDTPESLKMLLDIYPEKERVGIILLSKKYYNKTLLEKAVQNPESLKVLLDIFNKDQEFSEYLQSDSLLINLINPLLLHAVNMPESLKVLMEFIPENRRTTVIIESYDFLHELVSKPASLKTVLELVPEHQRLSIIQISIFHKSCLFNNAVKYPESLKIILDLLPENERLAAIQKTDDAQNTILHHATKTPDSLQIIIEYLPEAQRVATFQMVNNRGNTVLHKANNTPASLAILLRLYPEEQKYAALLQRDHNEKNVLCWAIENSNSLEMVLALYPEEERIVAVHLDSLLHAAIKYPESLKILLTLYPVALRHLVIQLTNKDGETVLSLVSNCPLIESFVALVSVLSEDQRLATVRSDETRCKLIAQYAEFKAEFLNEFLVSLPQVQRFEALQMLINHYDYLFDYIAKNPQTLNDLLTVLDESQRIAVLQIANRKGNTLLHLVDLFSQPIHNILATMPIELRVPLIQLQNKEGDTVLHKNAKAPQILKLLLELIPIEDRLATIQIINKYHMTVMHTYLDPFIVLKYQKLLASDPEDIEKIFNTEYALRTVLTLLPEEQRLAPIEKANDKGNSLSKYALKEPEVLAVLRELIPQMRDKSSPEQSELVSNSFFGQVASDEASVGRVLRPTFP